jgi:MFS family permease
MTRPSTRRVARAADAFRHISRNRDVRRLQAAQAGVELGAWAFGIAFSIYAYEVGGAALVGLAAFSRLLAAAVAAPFTGVLADRHERRLVLTVANALAAVVLVTIAAAVALGAPAVYAVVLCGAFTVCLSGFRPAKAALLPSLTRSADELTAANIVSSSIESVSLFAGPAIGGLIAALTGTWVVFALTAVVFAAAAVLVRGLPAEPARDRSRAHAPQNALRAAGEGLATLVGDRRLRILVGMFTAQTLVLGALNVLLVVTALETLHTGQSGVGLLNSSIGAGAIVGSVFAAGLIGRRLAPALGIGIFAWGLPIALIGVFPYVAVAVPLLMVVGAANTFVDVSTYTMLQRAVDDRLRARVMGALESLVMASIAIGGGLAPILIAFAGTRGALIASGVFLPVVVTLLWQRLRQIDADTVWPAHEAGVLSRIEIFSALPRATVEHLAAGLIRVRVPAGREIVTQGTVGRRFYVVDDGEIDVIVDGELVRTDGPGGYFGEISLLRDHPRTATVRARNDVELLALEPDAFVTAVTGHAPAAEVAEVVIGERLAHARPQLASL